jgi:protein-S-isoprenylcysteine O-methyltransferase Ste14
MAAQDKFADASNSIRFGRWLFKKRDYTPVPLIIFAAAIAMPNTTSIAIGIVVMILGESVRLLGVSYIGGVSRTRSDGTGKLICSGPFGRVRNPLYVGNFFLSAGAVMLTGLWWFIPIFMLLFGLQYHFIVLYEEENLKEKFGTDYDEFCKTVPRWLPLGPGGIDGDNPITPNFGKAVKSEISTFGSILAVSGIFILKYVLLPDTSVWGWIIG